MGGGTFVVLIWYALSYFGVDELQAYVMPLILGLLMLGWNERLRGGHASYRVPTLLGLLIIMGFAFYQSLDDVIYAVLLLVESLSALGRAAYGAGIEDEVKPNLFQALKYSVEVHSSQAPLETFIQIAFILSQASEDWAQERAVELYGLATRYPYVSKSRWLMDTAGLEIEESIRELPVDFVATHRARGRVLEVWGAAAALREELSTHGWADWKVFIAIMVVYEHTWTIEKIRDI